MSPQTSVSCCFEVRERPLGPSGTVVLRFVEKYFLDGLAKNASNLESESETGIVFPGLDRNDSGAGHTNAFG
jgi:hypothetical protein